MTKTTQTCSRCAGAGLIDAWNPKTKTIETMTCPACAGAGTVDR